MRHMSVVAVVLLLTAVSGCSGDPEKLKLEYVASGDRYVANEKYAEAMIQYRNAIALDPRLGDARFKLAKALDASGDFGGAFGEYVRAADLMPNDPKVQLAAGQRYLIGRHFPEARARATAILEKDPKDVDGLILMGNALAGLKDFEEAIAQLEQAVDLDPRRTLWYTNLGAVQMEKGDNQAAERVFKRAVEMLPQSAAPRLSLANFYRAMGRQAEAETELKAALSVEPRSRSVFLALASFYTESGRTAEAEGYYKTYADLTGDATAKILLADFYLGAGKSSQAVPLLEAVATDKTEGIPATLRLAALDYDGGNKTKGYEKVEGVLQQEPKNEQAILLKARFLAFDKKPTESLTLANKALEINPKSMRGQYVKAAALEATGAIAEAIQTWRGMLATDGALVPVQLRLARLLNSQQNFSEAAQLAGLAVKALPQSIEAHLVLGDALMQMGNLAAAEPEFKFVASARPNLPETHNALGNLYRLKGNLGLARASYLRALELQPKSLVALSGLIQIDLAENKAEAARSRIRAWLAESPDDLELWLIAGSTFARVGDAKEAEAAFQKILALDPTNLEAYNKLGAIYVAQRRLDEAKKTYSDAATRLPKPVAAITMVGIILSLQNQPEQARAQYERALSIEPEAPVAANNLAWDNVVRGGNLDVALQLAQTAKAKLPNNAEVSDTLGWIYYKKGLAGLAITALKDGVTQDRSNPLIHYHLGLAYVKNGNRPEAQRSLEEALKLDPRFAGADDAKRVLGTLKG